MPSDVASETLPNSIPQNLSGIGICGKNMRPRWSIASTFRPLLTDGDIMLIEACPVVFPLSPTKMYTPQPLRPKWRSRYLRRLLKCAVSLRCELIADPFVVTWFATSWARRNRNIQVYFSALMKSKMLIFRKIPWCRKDSYPTFAIVWSHIRIYAGQANSWPCQFWCQLRFKNSNRWCEWGRKIYLVSSGSSRNLQWFHFNDRIKLLTSELTPLSGQVNRNGRLRMYVLFFGMATLNPSVIQWIFCATSCWHIKCDHESCPVPCIEVSGKTRRRV